MIGVRPTLDLSVGHPDHNYLAEGIVVSNSHAVSYGYLTAAATYLKAKYPSAFYLSMLRLAREEPNALEYMNAIMAEMRAFTPIKILPPDILHSEPDFSLEKDKETGLEHIRFGLSHIKGISDLTMTKLASFRRGTFTSKVEVFEAAKAAGVNISTLASLILSGCLSWPGVSRTKLVLEAQTYNLLSDTQKAKVKQFAAEADEDVIATLKLLTSKVNEKGKPLIPTSQMDTLRRKYQPYWEQYQHNCRNDELAAYIYEKHYLGFSYSSTLHRCFSRKVMGLLDLASITARGKAYGEANAKRPKNEKVYGDPMSFVAWVDEVKSCISQKSGKPYIKLMLSDDSGTVRAMLFDEERIESCRRANEGQLPKEGDIVSCEGTFAREGGLVFIDTLIVQPSPIQLKRTSPADKEPPI